MHGSALIELSHNPLSSGYVYDSVPLGQAMMEHDRFVGCIVTQVELKTIELLSHNVPYHEGNCRVICLTLQM